MAGVKFDGTAATASLRGLLAGIENPAPLLAQLGEYTLRTTRDRFKTQTGPDGTAWAALQPWYKKEKSQNKNRVLTLRGFLRGQLVSQVVGASPSRWAATWFMRPCTSSAAPSSPRAANCWPSVATSQNP